LLYTVGLGKGAVPIAAAINWVLKDGIGYLSKILLSKFGRHLMLIPRDGAFSLIFSKMQLMAWRLSLLFFLNILFSLVQPLVLAVLLPLLKKISHNDRQRGR
jgi:hypothetical protein